MRFQVLGRCLAVSQALILNAQYFLCGLRLGIFTSATVRTVATVRTMLETAAGVGPGGLFEPNLVLHRQAFLQIRGEGTCYRCPAGRKAKHLSYIEGVVPLKNNGFPGFCPRRGHTSPLEVKTAGAKGWDTVKPLSRWFSRLHRCVWLVLWRSFTYRYPFTYLRLSGIHPFPTEPKSGGFP